MVIDYSHGMRKKLVLAAALLHGPRLLFLDEPFEAIDPVSARAIRLGCSSTSRAAEARSCSPVMSWSWSSACAITSRSWSRGRIAWVGPLDALRGSGTLEDAFVAVVGEPAERQGLSWLEHSSD